MRSAGTPEMMELKFDDHCQSAVQGLRRALLGLYREVGADPTKPQDVSRRYQLNKNLTWKVARIIGTDNALEAVRLIPGAGGLDILLAAMDRGGAPEASIERVRSAMGEFERMVETHMGDRGQLELALDSMGVGRPMEQSRKHAFRGNSGIWGVQAMTRFTAHFLAPNAGASSMLDLGMIGGLTRMRRLRAIERWPVFQLRNYNDDGSVQERALGRVAIEPERGGAAGDPWLMRSFCSANMPAMHVRALGDTKVYEIGDGPVGRQGEFSCCFGFAEVGTVPRYADAANTVGELISSVSMPVELLHFDLFIHRDLQEAMDPEYFMMGTLGGAIDGVGAMRLPLPERFNDLGLNAMVDTAMIDRYGDAVERVLATMGHDRALFRCLRLTVEHPPLSSRVVVRYQLPESPSSGSAS